MRIIWISLFISTFLVSGCRVQNHKNFTNAVSNHSAEEKPTGNIEPNQYKNLYFGDLHVHTSLSADAYINGTLVSSDQAFRFAKGEEIEIAKRKMKLRRPLDFCAITDHAEGLGEMYMVQIPGAKGHKAIIPSYIRGIFNADSTINKKRQRQILNIGARQLRKIDELNHPFFFRGYGTTTSAWDLHLEAVQDHYNPGTFTTLAGYEWTLGGASTHMHRNIIFRDLQVPEFPLSSIELRNENELWDWLEEISNQGATVMAIPHNSNLSNGGVFTDHGTTADSINIRRAELRQRFERLVEIHQIKGNSEVSALLWKNDEFADFENYSEHDPIEQDYVRYALKKGLQHEEHLGINPFKYGLIGSTDNHDGNPGSTEETESETKEKADSLRNTGFPLGDLKVYEVENPGGLVAVWAESNTRENVYDALDRREAYATSGNRIQIRFFAGYGFKKSYQNHQALLKDGYEKGVPMGSDLNLKKKRQPEFLIWAAKDPEMATLDRIQVVKGWHKDGALYEQIFDVALSDGRKLNPDGTVPNNGAIVNMETGEWSFDKGDEELFTHWQDPYFDAELNAFYYLRVLETPTASWRLLDQIRYGIQYPDNAELVVQERAWSSPIWIKPQ
jgi:hypothetical protein